MIWESLLQPRFVRFSPPDSNPHLDEAIAMRDANHETRSMIARTHRVSFREWHVSERSSHGWRVLEPRYHLMDIDRDTFRTMNMQLPMVRTTPAWPLSGGSHFVLPIKKLLSLREETPDRSLSRMQAVVFTRPVIGLRLGNLTLLEELTMAFAVSSKDWWIPGFEEYGPHIVNKPDEDLVDDETRGTEDYHLACQAGAYFEKLGIRGDTGLRWPSPCQEKSSNCEHTDLQHGHLGWATRKGKFLSPKYPRIGLRGFSRNSVSMGGQWAGYRYHEATPLVEFSPLSWDEVKDTMYEAAKDNGTAYFQFPQLIVKVFIVRAGQVPYDAPHHCWTTVVTHLPGETESMRAIRTLWRHVEYMVEKQYMRLYTMIQMD